MEKVSVILPSRNERFLENTVNDVFNKAEGDVEVIAVLDGYWPNPPLTERKNLSIIHRGKPYGLRHAVNAGVSLARGKYILKADAHCMFAPGFDTALQNDCDTDWIVIPSRYSLDGENWTILLTGKARVDYHYLCYPFTDEPGLHGVQWDDRRRSRVNKAEYDIDEEMSFQGSSYFLHKTYFEKLKVFDTDPNHYGTFIEEPQELGLSCWLSGGKIMTNKKTWYAHLHKGKQYGRGYNMNKGELVNGAIYSVDYWMNNRGNYPRTVEWLVEHFWPVPTWPSNWKEILSNEKRRFREKHSWLENIK
jgi:glycosyltransferase involved in cell wall biosynthesis